MPVATQTPATMPTDAAFEQAKRKMGDAVDALLHVVQSIYYGVGRFKGERAPTLEEIGRVVAFTEGIRGHVGEVTSWFATLEKCPAELDYVRVLDNRPDIDGEVDDA